MNTLRQSATSPEDTFTKKECDKEIKAFHHKLFDLQNVFFADGRSSLLIILQGMDTAGKDGVIRHVLSCMNPMGIQVKSFKVPTVEELRHDFLWRIYPHFPAKSMIQVFNRSYYEDIVVPFIGREFTKEKLHERCVLINTLEKHLEDSRTHILKFFLNVSHKEQKERIKERLDQPNKRWKYDQADTVAADKYDEYMEAYDKVINECNSNEWHIIPADQKWYRNYAVAKILTEYLEAMPLKYPGLKNKVSKT
jgi:PPK2 family polyphosphate:nucleotide phosphotransferase